MRTLTVPALGGFPDPPSLLLWLTIVPNSPGAWEATPGVSSSCWGALLVPAVEAAGFCARWASVRMLMAWFMSML